MQCTVRGQTCVHSWCSQMAEAWCVRQRVLAGMTLNVIQVLTKTSSMKNMLAEYEPVVCPGGQERKWHPGLYQEWCGQQE